MDLNLFAGGVSSGFAVALLFLRQPPFLILLNVAAAALNLWIYFK